MQAKKDEIEVVNPHLLEAVGGAKPEPEEVPARRIITVGADVQMNTGQKVNGQMTTRFMYEDTAQTMAIGAKQPCHACRFFNQARFLAIYRKHGLNPSSPYRNDFQTMRHYLSDVVRDDNARSMHTDGDGEFDVEASLQSMGVCDTITEMIGEEMFVHPLSGCPQEMPSKTEKVQSIGKDGKPEVYLDGMPKMTAKMVPFVSLFLDKNKKAGDAIYDGVMFMAKRKRGK